MFRALLSDEGPTTVTEYLVMAITAASFTGALVIAVCLGSVAFQ